ncbi:MAG: DUF6798 domain-containing protein [Candidatus Altiarchaeota archaeon]
MVRKINVTDHWLVLVVFLLSIVYITGYDFSLNSNDPNEQLPLIKRVLDKEYLTNDWYVNSSQAFSIRSYYTYVVAFFPEFIGLANVYFILYLLSYSLTIYASYRISKMMLKDNLATLLVMFMVIFGPNASLGSFRLVEWEFIPRSLANPLILLGIYFILNGSLPVSGFLFGLASIFHPSMGILMGVVFLTYLLFNARSIGLREVLKSSACFIVVSLFVIIPTILLGSSVSDPEAIAIFTKVVSPHIFFPTYFGLNQYLTFMSLAALVALAIKYGSKLDNTKAAFSLIALILMLALTGAFFTEIVPLPWIYIFNLFRPMQFAYLFGFIFVSGFLAHEINRSTSPVNRIIPLAVASSFAASYVMSATTILYLVYVKYLRNRIESLAPKKALVGIVAVLVLATASITIYLFHLEGSSLYLNLSKTLRLLGIFVFLASASSKVIVSYSKRVMDGYIEHLISIFIAMLVLFSVYQSGGLSTERMPRDPMTANLYQWVKVNTPKDAVFIIPPHLYTFRIGASRAVFADSFSRPFTDEGIIDWSSRMKQFAKNFDTRLGYDLSNDLKAGYNSTNTLEFERIGKTYGASYVLTEKPKVLEIDPVFENEKYVLYNLSQYSN